MSLIKLSALAILTSLIAGLGLVGGNYLLETNQTEPQNINNDVDKITLISTEEFNLLDLKQDPFEILEPSISNNVLNLKVKFSGGCSAHDFSIIGVTPFMESNPVQIKVVFGHDDNDDPCDSIISSEIKFDLTPLKQEYIQSYPGSIDGEIWLNFNGQSQSVLYEFLY